MPTGAQLNSEWNAGAAHALYSRNGRFYMSLREFPGGLFDPNGYVLFGTREEFEKSPHLRHRLIEDARYEPGDYYQKRVLVPGGISSIPGYVEKPVHKEVQSDDFEDLNENLIALFDLLVWLERRVEKLENQR